ncbi:MAG: hypothetical protein KAI79_01040 [Bacteroidales bacterium]|nr:hypothetical protein [Bacteroidales bacterium]
MKKRTIILWGGIALYLIIVLIAVSTNRNSVICNNIEVKFNDTSSVRLMDQKELVGLLEKIEGKILGEKMSNINIAKLEDGLNSNPLIETAELFKTIDGVLKVSIQQRNPIVRIYTDSLSYYIDNFGNILPLPAKYRPRVLLVNGNIKHKSRTITDVFEIAKFINNDEFWMAQIEQIYVNEKFEFELVPRVGAHSIYFGNAEDIEAKFNKLLALYQLGFQSLDWNKYKEINLKFENQVVCIK